MGIIHELLQVMRGAEPAACGKEAGHLEVDTEQSRGQEQEGEREGRRDGEGGE